MKAGKADHFIDELIWLVAVLGYNGDFVNDKARMGMTDELSAAGAMKTSHRVEYINYFDLLYQNGHQLENASNFRTRVQKETALKTGIWLERDSGGKGKAWGQSIKSPTTKCQGPQDCWNQSMPKCIVCPKL